MDSWMEALVLMSGVHGKPRRGWVLRGVPAEEAETVGMHTRMCVRAGAIYGSTRPDLDIPYLVSVLEVHDLPECGNPDYTPRDRVPKDVKHREELAVMDLIAGLAGDQGLRMRRLWLEYELGDRPEIVVAHDIDKADPCVRALEYIADYPTGDFYPDARPKIRTPDIRRCLDRLYATRDSGVVPYARWFSLLKTGGGRIDVFPNDSALYR